MITSIDFLEKDDRTFVLTASADGSVVLSDIHGNSYGIFGQPKQWRLDVDLTKVHEEELQLAESQHDDESQENSKLFDDESQFSLSSNANQLAAIPDDQILVRRSNVWDSTSIGRQGASMNEQHSFALSLQVSASKRNEPTVGNAINRRSSPPRIIFSGRRQV